MQPKSINELMSQHYPEQEYIVDRLIPDGSITILSGQSRSFKTYTLLEIALSVAKAEPLFGQFKTQKTGVLIIDEENGERLLQKRLRQLGKEMIDLPIYISSWSGFHLDDGHINSVLEFCETNKIGFIIIDALIRVHSADENSAREMSKVFLHLRSFTKANIAVLVTQHNRKAGTNYGGGANEMRGSSDILAAVDSHIGVVRKENTLLSFTQEKQRYDVELGTFKVRVRATKDSFQFEYLGVFTNPPEKSLVLLPIVISLLTEYGQLNKSELLEKLMKRDDVAINEHSLKDLLQIWVGDGSLPQPTKGKGKAKYYRPWESENG